MKCGCTEKDLENFLENPNSVNLRCADTWELICTGNVKGCFQIDGNLGRHYCKKIKPICIEELSDLIALIRPGCLEAFLDGKNMTDHYVDRKAGIEEVPHYHPIYDEIVKNTYGIMVYQEQLIKISEEIAGFNKQEADKLRAGVGKKKTDVIAECKKLFLEKGEAFGIASLVQLEEIFSWMMASARYLFNFSHSISYSYNAYISAYLKTHFPYRFFLSYLQHANDKPDAHEEISELITDARKFSITVQGPRIEHLKEVFYKDNENIRFGLQNIKSVGNSAFSKLPPEIPASWNTFLFFLAPKVNSKAVESLIGAGALSSYGIPRIRMLYELDKFLSLTDKEQDAIREVNPPTLLEGLDYLMKNKKYHNVRRLQYLQEIYKLLVAPPTKLEDNPDWLVQQENTLLGYPISASRIENFQTSRSNCTCKEFPTSELAHYSIVAEVKNRKEIVCKKGKSAGQKMAFLTIDDGTDAMEAVVFPKFYEEFSYLLSPGRIVLLKGTKDKERSSLIINKVFD